MRTLRLLHPSFARVSLLAAVLCCCPVTTRTFGQGQLAFGTIGSNGSGPFTYSLTFGDSPSATSPVGSVWYGWVPGQFFLPGTPTSASAPVGWTASIQANSIEFFANSSSFYIQPGSSLSGFSYQANFTPAQLAAAPNGGTSVAYAHGILSDAGNTFSVTAAPEPATLGLALVATLVVASRRHKMR